MTQALRPYQLHLADFVRNRKHGLVFVDVGLGKTAAMLHGLYGGTERPRTLVIAPKQVSISTWPTEASQWAPHIRSRTISGLGPTSRAEVVRDRVVDLATTNYEQIGWLLETFTPAKLRKLFDVVIFDEGDKLKAHNSDRFKRLKKRLGDFDRRYLMTGTPASESLLGLWAQAYAVDQGKTFGTSFTKWRDHFFESDYMGWVWTPRPGAQEAFYKMLAPMTFRLSLEQAGVQFPEVSEQTHAVQFTPEQRRLYEKLESDLIAHVRAGKLSFPDDDSADVIEAQSEASLSNKLRQVVSGFAYHTDRSQKPVILSEDKRELLDAHLEAMAQEGKQCLIAYWWHDEREWLARRNIPDLRDKPELLEMWNRGELPVMAIHPGSAGHGLNLQVSKCQHLWFMTVPWSLGLYTQTVGRLRRSGGASHVVVHLPIVEHSVDETVVRALKHKSSVQDAFLRRFST